MSAILAAIDVGTNTVLLTVAMLGAAGELVVIDQHATVTRLGQGVDQSRELHPDAEQRTLHCLSEYGQIMKRHGVTQGSAVGTSALRDVRGGSAFLSRAEQVLGFPLQVVSGAREAELTFRGALLGLAVEGRACVFDIGGGSTELILGDASTGRIDSSISLNIGSVRLTERLALSDPPNAEQRTQLNTTIEQELSSFDLSQARNMTVIGVAGTVTTLAAILMQMASYDPVRMHGARLRAHDLRALSERLFFMSVNERLNLSGLTKGRADVIGAGAVLCAAILKHTQAQELLVSDRGVRFGVLWEMAHSH